MNVFNTRTFVLIRFPRNRQRNKQHCPVLVRASRERKPRRRFAASPTCWSCIVFGSKSWSALKAKTSTYVGSSQSRWGTFDRWFPDGFLRRFGLSNFSEFFT